MSPAPSTSARVVGVASDDAHRFTKQPRSEIRIVEGIGVEGDAHAGDLVQHLSRIAKDPDQSNLRQVHLIHAELLDELAEKGFKVAAADLGENITTRGIDLLGLPRGTRLGIGETAVLEVTGLRNPCAQIEQFQPGLLAAVLDKTPAGEIVRKTGVMTIVRAGGIVRPGDPISVELPPLPHQRLECV